MQVVVFIDTHMHTLKVRAFMLLFKSSMNARTLRISFKSVNTGRIGTKSFSIVSMQFMAVLTIAHFFDFV